MTDDDTPATVPHAPRRRRRPLKFALRLAVSVALVGYFLWSLSRPRAAERTLVALRDECRAVAGEVKRPGADARSLALRAGDLAARFSGAAATYRASKRAADAAAAEAMDAAARAAAEAETALADGRIPEAQRALARALEPLDDYRLGFAKFPAAFAGVRWGWLALAASLHPLGFALTSLRWKILLRAQGARAGFGRLYLTYVMAAFFNTFLPGVYGGDIVRAYASARYTGRAAESVVVVVVERLTGLFALVLIAAVAFLAHVAAGQAMPSFMWVFFAAAAVGVVVLVGGSHPRVAGWVLDRFGRFLPARVRSLAERTRTAVKVYYDRPASLAAAQLTSLLFQLNIAIYYYLILRGLGQEVGLGTCLVAVPVMVVLLMVVPAINGIGVRTWSFQNLLNRTVGVALAAETVDLVLRTGIGLVGGLIFLLCPGARPAVNRQGKRE